MPNSRFSTTSVKSSRDILRAFVSVLRDIQRRHPVCCTYGLAVSGGVDSMALATLCSQFQKDSNSSIKFQAFVVDHVARPSSHEEAKTVAQYLSSSSIDIPTKILKLDWDRPPASLPDFETQARRQRFQALGRACRDSGIELLMLGHHADDQAETVLSRICSGYTGIGLRGIKSEAQIPECHGIYGVYESGKPMPSQLSLPSYSKDVTAHSKTMTEQGGVKICRPLLSFDKLDLRQFCETNETPWIEDETNKDPKLTTRNTVRYLFDRQTLPKAMSKTALLQIARSASDREMKRKELVRQAIGKCRIRLDTCSGRAQVHLPNGLFQDLARRANSDHQEISMRHLAELLVRHMLSLVTPQSEISARDLENPTRQLFSELDSPPSMKENFGRVTQVAKVRFELHDNGAPALLTLEDDHSPGIHYELSRALPSRAESTQAKLCLVPESAQLLSSSEPMWTPWKLFDGRFWIRVRHRPHHSLRGHRISVRFFQPNDIAQLRRDETKSEHLKELQELLAKHAPGKLRFTLPVIIDSYRDTDSSGASDEVDRILALPSLGWSNEHRGKSGAPDIQRGIIWQIHYKKID